MSEETALQKPLLEADPEKVKQFVEYALGRHEDVEQGEGRADLKFSEILSVKTFLDQLVGGYMDSIAEDNLVTLGQVNGQIVNETMATGDAIQAENMQQYIRGMSGLVGQACQAVGLATKVQAAKNRDLEGYRAELSDTALQMLDGAKKQYLNNGGSND
tara:strand:- start:2597 stop:3073 length:477 start_codon:yes stop_codon:yes gene_type:complete